jgi:cytochrome c oxidase assembly protein subunit 15
MILVGGATRLTDSGLSITEWNFAKGVAPPMSAQAWDVDFNLYRQTTEYQVQNRGISLSEFQYIYFWEWGHRFLGKIVGLVWLLGFMALLIAGRLKGRLLAAIGMGVLGGLQGAIGWWMVTSGLWSGLDVSPWRLAAHLGMAFLILGIGVRLTLGAFGWPRVGGSCGLLPGWRWGYLGLIFAQILTGALVAGSDAGRAYSDWPTIGGALIPHGYSPLAVGDHASVQFTHRTLGYLVVCASLLLLVTNRHARAATRATTRLLAGIALAQMSLGIATIVLGAPLWISLAHQFGAVVLWVVAGAWMTAQALGYHNTTPESHAPHGMQQGA